MKDQEYISINHKLDRTFRPDPMLQAIPFKKDPDLAPGRINLEFKDYMIPWYRPKDPHDKG